MSKRKKDPPSSILLQLRDAQVRLAAEKRPLAEKAAADLGLPFEEIDHADLFNRMHELEQENS